jgi:hypothetical protein
LDADGLRRLPGMLGDRRIIDSVITLGTPSGESLPGMPAFRMVDDAGCVSRVLGTDLAESPMHTAWRDRRSTLISH